jgi:hypothetical protein
MAFVDFEARMAREAGRVGAGIGREILQFEAGGRGVRGTSAAFALTNTARS